MSASDDGRMALRAMAERALQVKRREMAVHALLQQAQALIAAVMPERTKLHEWRAGRRHWRWGMRLNPARAAAHATSAALYASGAKGAK